MNPKNTKKSLIHENADANITCNFGDGDISHFRSRLPHGHIVSSIIVRFLYFLCRIDYMYNLPLFLRLVSSHDLFDEPIELL